MPTQIPRKSDMDSHLVQNELLEPNRRRIAAAIQVQFTNQTQSIIVNLHQDTNSVTAKTLITEIQLAGWIVAKYNNDCRITIHK